MCVTTHLIHCLSLNIVQHPIGAVSAATAESKSSITAVAAEAHHGRVGDKHIRRWI